MTNFGAQLPPEAGLRHAGRPEGGEVGPVQSGWQLAAASSSRTGWPCSGVALIVLRAVLLPRAAVLPRRAWRPTSATNLAPGDGHPLGTDNDGYDELGRLMKGGQAALEIGFLSALIATLIGAAWGAVCRAGRRGARRRS